MLIDTAKAAASQVSLGNKLCMVTPTIADNKWPPIKLRGCAKGLFITPYINTADAPNEPIRKRLSVSTKYLLLIKPSMAIPVNEPKNVSTCSFVSINVSR
jgi:hypothetical protein